MNGTLRVRRARSAPWRVILLALTLGLVLAAVLAMRAVASPRFTAWAVKIQALARPTDMAQHNKLYVLSHIPRADGKNAAVGGRVTVVDQTTRQALRTIETGIDVDAIPSPDGTRLYIAAKDRLADDRLPGENRLFALDTATGAELWRIPVPDRMSYIGGRGPSTLALSPDGRWLYIYSYAWNQSSGVRQRLEIVDTGTGQKLPDRILLPGCDTASLAVSHDGTMLYVTCFSSNDIRFVNARTRQVERQVRIPDAPEIGGLPGGIAGSILAPDGRTLYVVTDTVQVLVVDAGRGTIAPARDLDRRNYRAVPQGAVALVAEGKYVLVALSSSNDAAGANEMRLFETGTWREVRRLPARLSLAGSALAVSPDGSAVYAAGLRFSGKPLPDADTILALSLLDGRESTPLARTGEDILRLFTGP